MQMDYVLQRVIEDKPTAFVSVSPGHRQSHPPVSVSLLTGWPCPPVASNFAAATKKEKTLIKRLAATSGYFFPGNTGSPSLTMRTASENKTNQIHNQEAGRQLACHQEHPWVHLEMRNSLNINILNVKSCYAWDAHTVQVAFKTVWHTRGCLDIVNFVLFFFLSTADWHVVFISLTLHSVNDNHNSNMAAQWSSCHCVSAATLES